MSDLVGNPEDRFSRVEAHFFSGVSPIRYPRPCLVSLHVFRLTDTLACILKENVNLQSSHDGQLL